MTSFNVNGAHLSDHPSIKASTSTGRIHKQKDIFLPHQHELIHHIGIDIGGTLAKVAYFTKNKNDDKCGGMLKFFKIETEKINEFINYLQRLIVTIEIENGIIQIDRSKDMEYYIRNFKNHAISVFGTGGGSILFQNKLAQELHLSKNDPQNDTINHRHTATAPFIKAKDEMESLIVGLNFLIHNIPNEVFVYDDNTDLKIEDERKLKYINFLDNDQQQLADSIYPYLLVNIGSGVSMIKVTGPRSFIRIGGSSIGGGTLWGILSLLTNAKTYDDMLTMASNGDNANVDMLVGDIYGASYNKIGLKSTTIASSFGKVFKTVTGKMDGGYNKNDESVYGSEYDDGLNNTSALSLSSEDSASVITGRDDNQYNDDIKASQSPQTPSNERSDSTSNNNGYYHQQEVENVYPSLSQFQRLSKFRQSDISKSFLYAVSNNIGQIAYLQASKYKLKKIFFAGSFIRNHLQTIITLSYAINFWSQGEKQAYFLRHEGYLGAIGAFLSAYEDEKFYNDYLTPKHQRE
ncbi:pantothenate kinase [Saccharomycopsis crataegensis]|uniref:Pantothenate kinase n=1 Tax=Saccharomycopsis crataegensis TaxID=43959 RepID=A0AAV5QX57_9ASCO|nr:pantothenate kinase [Saccharomycopsis crataegensis]